MSTGSATSAPRRGGAAYLLSTCPSRGPSGGRWRSGQETDAIGRQINAYTTKELTCYYTRCLDSHLPRAIDLLSDMLFHSPFLLRGRRAGRGVVWRNRDVWGIPPEDLAAGGSRHDLPGFPLSPITPGKPPT